MLFVLSWANLSTPHGRESAVTNTLWGAEESWNAACWRRLIIRCNSRLSVTLINPTPIHRYFDRVFLLPDFIYQGCNAWLWSEILMSWCLELKQSNRWNSIVWFFFLRHCISSGIKIHIYFASQVWLKTETRFYSFMQVTAMALGVIFQTVGQSVCILSHSREWKILEWFFFSKLNTNIQLFFIIKSFEMIRISFVVELLDKGPHHMSER